MSNFSTAIENEIYLSQDGLSNWGEQYGSFDDIYPLSNGLPSLATNKVPSCADSSYYGYYISNWPLSEGLDPTPWYVRPNDCACNYGAEMYNRYGSMENYIKGKFDVENSSASFQYLPTYSTCGSTGECGNKGNCACGYNSELFKDTVFNQQNNSYLLHGNEATLRF